jgi:hypothetical protein
MGVAHLVGLGIATAHDERVRLLRQLERRVAERPSTPTALLVAIHELLMEAEAERSLSRDTSESEWPLAWRFRTSEPADRTDEAGRTSSD